MDTAVERFTQMVITEMKIGMLAEAADREIGLPHQRSFTYGAQPSRLTRIDEDTARYQVVCRQRFDSVNDDVHL